MENKKITRANVSSHLLDYQLNMIGKTRILMIDDNEWYFNNTLTREQHEQFKAYAIPLLQKTFKFRKSKAEEAFSWFELQFGLRIKD